MTTHLSDPLNVPFNEYRIRFLGKRLKQLRTSKKRIESTIAAFEREISERTAARKENQCSTGQPTPSSMDG